MVVEQGPKKRKAAGEDEIASVKKVRKAISETLHKATDGPVVTVPKILIAPKPEKGEVTTVTVAERGASEQPSVKNETKGISKKSQYSYDALRGTEKAISKKTKQVKAPKEASAAEVPAEKNEKFTSEKFKSSKKGYAVEENTEIVKSGKEVESSQKKKAEASKSVEDISFDDNNDDDDSENDEDDEEIDDQTEALSKVFESDDEDTADAGVGYELGEPIPDISKKAKKKAKAAVEKYTSDTPGVVYLGRIPHGFYEHEMRQYFGQFGDILRLRLSRNRKTGSSKHFAFVEFKSAEVADIVVKTMDNYLLFGHILRCKLVAPEQVHKSLWKGANRRFKKVPWNKIEGRKLEQGMTQEGWDRRIEREEKRREKKGGKMAALDYDFESPKLKSTKNVSK